MSRRLAALLALLAGCAEAEGKDDSGFVDDGQPHVFIVAPEAGAAVDGCFALEVEVYNFTLVSPVEEVTPVDGRGHFHAVFGPRYFDCEDLVCDIALTDDVPGDVTVVAQLVGNDHNAIADDAGDAVTDERTFAYSGEPCAEE